MLSRLSGVSEFCLKNTSLNLSFSNGKLFAPLLVSSKRLIKKSINSCCVLIITGLLDLAYFNFLNLTIEVWEQITAYAVRSRLVGFHKYFPHILGLSTRHLLVIQLSGGIIQPCLCSRFNFHFDLVSVVSGLSKSSGIPRVP